MKVCGCCLHEQKAYKQHRATSPGISLSRSPAANELAAKAVAQQKRRGLQLRKYFQRLVTETTRKDRLPYAPTPRYFRPKPRNRKSPSRLSLPLDSQPEPTRHRFPRRKYHHSQRKHSGICESQSDQDRDTRKEIEKSCRELNAILARTERIQKRRHRESKDETASILKEKSNPYYQEHAQHHNKSSTFFEFPFDSNYLLTEMANDMKSCSSLISQQVGRGEGDAERSRSLSPTDAELTTSPCEPTQFHPQHHQQKQQPLIGRCNEMFKTSTKMCFKQPWPHTNSMSSFLKKSAATSPFDPDLIKTPCASLVKTPLFNKPLNSECYRANVLYSELTRPPSGLIERWGSGDDGQLSCNLGCQVHCPKDSHKSDIKTPPRESRSEFIAIIENAIGENQKDKKKKRLRKCQRGSDGPHRNKSSLKYNGLQFVAEAVQKSESNPLISEDERRLCSTIAFLLENHQNNKNGSEIMSCPSTSVEQPASSNEGTPTNSVPNSRRYLEQLRRLRCDHLRHIKREIRQLENLERFLHPNHFLKDLT